MTEKPYDINRIGTALAVNSTLEFSYPNLVDDLRNQAVMQLTAHILKDSAGDPVTKSDKYTVRYTESKFPRWFPKFLARRWSEEKTRVIHFDLTVQPEWLYPEYPVEQLFGTPVRSCSTEGIMIHE